MSEGARLIDRIKVGDELYARSSIRKVVRVGSKSFAIRRDAPGAATMTCSPDGRVHGYHDIVARIPTNADWAEIAKMRLTIEIGSQLRSRRDLTPEQLTRALAILKEPADGQ